MVFNRFAVSVVSRVMVLIITIFPALYLILRHGDRNIFFILFLLLSAIVIQVLLLIKYVTRTNRELSRFLLMLRNSDYTVKFTDKKLERSFRELTEIMDKTVESLRDLRIEKEIQTHLLTLITSEIRTGILTVGSDGKIVVMNPSARSILGSNGAQTWGQLRLMNPAFVSETDSLGGEGRKFTEITSGKEVLKVSINVSTVPLASDTIRIITMEDIQSQVEGKESDAWLRLMKILMHEMMNSITPLTSLTETLAQILTEKAGYKKLSELTAEDTDDIRFCLENIRKRKEHLQAFVGNYHRLSRLPRPEKSITGAFSLVNDVVCCMQTELDNAGIYVGIGGELQRMDLFVDASQIEQVLLNLLKNSIQAMRSSPVKQISIRGLEQSNYLVIEVADTGEGIPPEKINDIFIPFYSTKEEGSGIGLVLARQIMHAHQGSIRVKSEPGKGSSFFLWFEQHKTLTETR
jgi:two-component system, NtrC family, nitrogen regulation sensor histidine kinase NtrY